MVCVCVWVVGVGVCVVCSQCHSGLNTVMLALPCARADPFFRTASSNPYLLVYRHMYSFITATRRSRCRGNSAFNTISTFYFSNDSNTADAHSSSHSYKYDHIYMNHGSGSRVSLDTFQRSLKALNYDHLSLRIHYSSHQVVFPGGLPRRSSQAVFSDGLLRRSSQVSDPIGQATESRQSDYIRRTWQRKLYSLRSVRTHFQTEPKVSQTVIQL